MTTETMSDISILQAAQAACIDIYSMTGFDKIIKVGCDVIGMRKIGDTTLIVPEGSASESMWINNFDALPQSHKIFGLMHSGFLQSAESIYSVIKPLMPGKVAFAGHSRAAALCNILASMCALDDIHVSGLYLFECPNVGMNQYGSFCTAHVANGNIEFMVSTINGLDPVPFQPPWCDPSYPRTNLNHAPGGFEDCDVADWHIGATIFAGVKKMFPV